MLLHYLVKHYCQKNKPLATNYKVVATYLRCGGVVNNQIKKGLLLSVWVKFFKRWIFCKVTSKNVHFLRLLAVCSSAVFTCIGALGTPSRTGALARKYLPGFPYSWSLRILRQKISSIYCIIICKLTRYALLVFVRSCSSINNKIISFKNLFHHSQLGAPQKEKFRGPWARAQCAHWLRRPWCVRRERKVHETTTLLLVTSPNIH